MTKLIFIIGLLVFLNFNCKAHDPVVTPSPKPEQSLRSKESLRRVIRQHLKEVRFCYEKELISKPDLKGKVTVKFTILSSGQVTVSSIQASTLKNVSAEQCIAKAVLRWKFPQIQGTGIVIVNYPFILKPTVPE